MKRLAFPVTTSTLLALSASGTDADPDPPKAHRSASVHPNVVLVARSASHLRSALRTARALVSGAIPTLHPLEIRIIACSEAAALTLRGSPLSREITHLAGHGIRTIACGLSVHRIGMARAHLFRYVDAVASGAAEVTRLEEEGWLSLEL